MNTYRGWGRGPQQFRGCGLGRLNFQNNAGTYQYQYYTHDQQSEQYGPPCSLCQGFNHSTKHCYKGEHDINNIMEKMSINPTYSIKGQYRKEWYNRAEGMVPQLDGTYYVSDDSDTDLHSYLDLASSNIIAHRTRGQKQRYEINTRAHSNRCLALKEGMKLNTNIKM